MSQPGLVLLDACAAVNLYATRRMHEILAVVPGSIAVVDNVLLEAQFVFRGGDGDDAREREPVDLAALITENLLAVLDDYSEDELLTYIDFSLDLDDGESMTAAVAVHRSAAVVTDDKKARRILSERGVRCTSSLQLVHDWATARSIGPAEQRAVLHDLRVRGTYMPPKSHPLRPWWEALTSLDF